MRKVRKPQRRRRNQDDRSEWSEIVEESSSGSVGTGGGGEMSADEWRRLSYPIFGKDDVANKLLMTLESMGGAGVRFTGAQISGELEARHHPARLKLGLAPAIDKLLKKRYVVEVQALTPSERTRFGLDVRGKSRLTGRLFEFTLLGHQAAVASAAVPAEREGQALAEDPERLAAQYAETQSFQPDVSSPALPWRAAGAGEDSFAFGELARRIAYTVAQEGPHVVARAFDQSAYMAGQEILVGEVAIRLTGRDTRRAPKRANVTWAWVHPEWDDAEHVVLKTLHEHVAQAAGAAGMALSSPLDMPPNVADMWQRQFQAGLAKPEFASRAVLGFPPPAVLANPPPFLDPWL